MLSCRLQQHDSIAGFLSLPYNCAVRRCHVAVRSPSQCPWKEFYACLTACAVIYLHCDRERPIWIKCCAGTRWDKAPAERIHMIIWNDLPLSYYSINSSFALLLASQLTLTFSALILGKSAEGSNPDNIISGRREKAVAREPRAVGSSCCLGGKWW